MEGGVGLRTEVVDFGGEGGGDGLVGEEGAKIVEGVAAGVEAAVVGGAGEVGGEEDVAQAAQGMVGGERFMGEDIEAEEDAALSGDAEEAGFVHQEAATDVDEKAAGIEVAEEVFGDAAEGGGIERGEGDDDVLSGEKGFEGRAAADAPGAFGGGIDIGGADIDLAFERGEEAEEFAGDAAEAVEADAAAEEGFGVGFAGFPSPLEVHGE